VMSLSRLMSIGNVNGMRYIGYALTCPLMQVELIVLIAPIVPFFKCTCVLVAFATWQTLMTGYVASLTPMPVWTGYLLTFMSTWDLDDLEPTSKFWIVSPAFCGISVLSLGIIPYLMLLYTINGGQSNPQLPQGYKTILCIVWVTWLAFPFWWLLSWEGQSIITDTKFNEVGFGCLNLIAKGLFVWQGFRMSHLHESEEALQSETHTIERLAPSKSNDSYRSHETCKGGFSRKSLLALQKSSFVKLMQQFDTYDWSVDACRLKSKEVSYDDFQKSADLQCYEGKKRFSVLEEGEKKFYDDTDAEVSVPLKSQSWDSEDMPEAKVCRHVRVTVDNGEDI